MGEEETYLDQNYDIPIFIYTHLFSKLGSLIVKIIND